MFADFSQTCVFFQYIRFDDLSKTLMLDGVFDDFSKKNNQFSTLDDFSKHTCLCDFLEMAKQHQKWQKQIPKIAERKKQKRKHEQTTKPIQILSKKEFKKVKNQLNNCKKYENKIQKQNS